MSAEAPAARPPRRSLARNTALFSILTGLSRVAGLARETLAAAYFGLGGPASAFTLAFYIPNTVRSLVADSALSAAFVPVFTELQEEGRKGEAYRLASTLFLLILGVLGAVVVVFILTAGWIVPIFTGDKFTHLMDVQAIGLSRVMFPIVLLLALNGLVVGILQAYDHFTIPALSALVWNVVIMTFLVGGRPFFHGDDDIYAYAVGVLAGTAVQFGMALPVLRQVGFHFEWSFDPRDPRVRRVLVLMFSVSLGLGLINFNVLANSILGGYVSTEAPRAIDNAFRIYMLPQGMFSVAIATVLFPTLSRFAARQDLDGLRDTVGNGLRLIFLMLLPAAAATAVLATPITRLVYQHGNFTADDTELVAEALFWFSFSLPFSGVNLLLSRSFFSLQRPWTVTALSVANLVVNVGSSIALLHFGIAGIVIGTAIADVVMAGLQLHYLRRMLDRPLALRSSWPALLAVIDATMAFGLVAWLGYEGLDWLLGRSFLGQLLSVTISLGLGAVVYAAIVLRLEVAEALQLRAFVTRRRRAPA